MTTALIALGIVLAREAMVLIARWALRDRPLRKHEPICTRMRSSWALTPADRIQPVRPGTRPARGAAVGRPGGDADQHKADSREQRPSSRHADPRVLRIVADVELVAAARKFSREHPEETIVILPPSARGGAEIVN